MNLSSVVAKEIKGLNNKQLKLIYQYIKSFKKEKTSLNEDISLEEVWKITAKSGSNWSKEIEEMRE